MAVYFGSGNAISLSSALVSDEPLTISTWVNCDDITNYHRVAAVSEVGGTDQRMQLTVDGTRSSPVDPVGAEHKGSSSNRTARSTVAYQQDVWEHIGGVWTDNSNRASWLNGIEYTDSGDIGTITLGESWIGESMLGAIADAAFWNVALSDDEMISLSNGYPPLLIRPQSLIAYLPLMNATGS